MPSVTTMVLRSLRLIGEKTRGATLTTAEQAECLAEMNSMVDSWGLQRGLIQNISQTSFALTQSVGTYTIGVGATFNMIRPIKVVNPCFTRDTDNVDIPLELIDADVYGRIIDKTLGDTTPGYLFYNQAYSSTSTATIRLYPLPDSGLTLFINTLQPLEAISTVTQIVQLPPGYQEAIEYNYAVRAAGGFTNVQPEVALIARSSLAAIKQSNLPQPISALDYGIVPYPHSNILNP